VEIFDNRISTGNYKLVAKRTDPLCVRSEFYGQATKGVRVDALAQAGEEGRGKLRKASGSRKQAVIRGCPNGGTQRVRTPAIAVPIHKAAKQTRGSEPSQYPEEEKTTVIPKVAASEIGGA
jgi:hypothetical protein